MQAVDTGRLKTIDDILTALEDIIADCTSNNDRRGYFAALYYKVTARVKEGIQNNEFEKGPRMEQFDVAFAKRYIYAYYAWQENPTITNSWKVALDASKSNSKLVLQHLLLGMNAHINLDLGIIADEVATGHDLTTIHKDFNEINSILALLTYQVINDLRLISPLLSMLGLNAGDSDSILIQFSIGNARDGAWCFAEDLNAVNDAAYTAVVEARDTDITNLGNDLIKNKGFLRFGIWFIHLFEKKNPAKIINILHNHTKKKWSALPH